MSEFVLTHAIDCEWCGAKAGEGCWIQPRAGSHDPRPYQSSREVHMIRGVRREQHEAWLAAVADRAADTERRQG